MTFDPPALLAEIEAATTRLLASVRDLTDAEAASPSLLPSWTRAHVLTHLARNADGGTRLLTWARTGVPSYEYPSLEARAAEIEAGASRPAPALVEDVRTSAARFATACRRMPPAAWTHPVRWTAGQEHPAARAADARLTEVLFHHVDLALDYTPADWPPAFVTDALTRAVRSLSPRPDTPHLRLHATDTGATHALGPGGPTVRGPQSALLAWLVGRSPGTGLTPPDPPTPPALF